MYSTILDIVLSTIAWASPFDPKLLFKSIEPANPSKSTVQNRLR